MTIDTRYKVNTPEGISLSLSPAGPVPRMYAWMIDILIRIGINIIIYASLGSLGKTGIGIAMILTFLLEWFYPVYFELYKKGQTPGKKSLNLYVSMENASPITPAASIIRNLLRFVDFLPLFYGFGFITMLLTKRFQRLGDLVANTVVLHKAAKPPIVTDVDVPTISPKLALNLNEQQALIRFHQRTNYLTKERADELASHTGNLIKDEKDGAIYLLGIANWIMGVKQ